MIAMITQLMTSWYNLILARRSVLAARRSLFFLSSWEMSYPRESALRRKSEGWKCIEKSFHAVLWCLILIKMPLISTQKSLSVMSFLTHVICCLAFSLLWCQRVVRQSGGDFKIWFSHLDLWNGWKARLVGPYCDFSFKTCLLEIDPVFL